MKGTAINANLSEQYAQFPPFRLCSPICAGTAARHRVLRQPEQFPQTHAGPSEHFRMCFASDIQRERLLSCKE